MRPRCDPARCEALRAEAVRSGGGSPGLAGGNAAEGWGHRAEVGDLAPEPWSASQRGLSKRGHGRHPVGSEQNGFPSAASLGTVAAQHQAPG